MVAFFNTQVDAFLNAHPNLVGALSKRTSAVRGYVDHDPTKYSWERSDYGRVAAGKKKELDQAMIRQSLYRPFFKQRVAFDRSLNGMTYQLPKLFPTPDAQNVGISIVSQGSKAPFGVAATDTIPCLHLIGSDATSFLARWRYEEPNDADSLFGSESGWKKVSNLNPDAVRRFQVALGPDIDDDAVFHYVYGALHSPEFRERYESNLKKEAPRVPMPARPGNL
jgi:predicted helicase